MGNSVGGRESGNEASKERSKGTTEQRTKEWYEERAKRITASDFATAIGLYGSRIQLVGEKIGVRERRTFDPRAVEWGVKNEESARLAYEAATGYIVVPQGFIVHDEHDWLGGSPDGIIGTDDDSKVDVWEGGVEIKCPKVIYEEVPDRYMPQIQGLAQICGWDYCDFVCWTPEEFRVWRVMRSNEYWDWMFPKLAETWAFIEAKVLPPKTQRRPIYTGTPIIIERKI